MPFEIHHDPCTNVFVPKGQNILYNVIPVKEAHKSTFQRKSCNIIVKLDQRFNYWYPYGSFERETEELAIWFRSLVLGSPEMVSIAPYRDLHPTLWTARSWTWCITFAYSIWNQINTRYHCKIWNDQDNATTTLFGWYSRDVKQCWITAHAITWVIIFTSRVDRILVTVKAWSVLFILSMSIIIAIALSKTTQ